LIDEENRSFWDELCGSQAAEMLGINDSSPESLKKFDDWYFDFYPYLKPFLSAVAHPDIRLLEVGLGYGTVSEYLAEIGVAYSGLDIAQGPVNMVTARLASKELQGDAHLGSILSPPFPSQSFDAVVAIGSLHHTGDLQEAISTCHSLLVPGGKLLFMVYNAYSYRRWLHSTNATFRLALREGTGYRGVVGDTDDRQRGLYDTNRAGDGAPHTDWISRRSLNFMLRDFRSTDFRLLNMDSDFPPFRTMQREKMLRSRWGARLGLDIYVQAVK